MQSGPLSHSLSSSSSSSASSLPPSLLLLLLLLPFPFFFFFFFFFSRRPKKGPLRSIPSDAILKDQHTHPELRQKTLNGNRNETAVEKKAAKKIRMMVKWWRLDCWLKLGKSPPPYLKKNIQSNGKRTTRSMSNFCSATRCLQLLKLP